MDKIHLILDKECLYDSDHIVDYIDKHYNKKVIVKDYLDETGSYDDSLYLLYLDDNKIKKFIKNNLYKKFTIAILPNDNCPLAVKSYGILKNLNDAIDDSLNLERYTTIDLLICNNEPIFNNVTIGDVHGLNDCIEKQSKYKRFTGFLKNLRNLRLQEFTFVTSKEYELNTAAAGIMILEHNLIQNSDDVITEKLYNNDGKLNAFVLAPKSILSYIYYLVMIFFYAHFKVKSLPQSVGILKTSKLTISSNSAINFKLDESYVSSKYIELEILKQSITVALGRNILNIEDSKKVHDDGKEIIKTKELPQGEVKKMLLSKKIPLFKKAQESDFKELFISLRDSAKLSSVFLVLMVLSTLLATTGLFQNSAPVIIGAMVLAPLMAPIVSLSMGVVRGENEMIQNSAKTLSYGILTALLFSVIFTYFMPLTNLTDEMRGRLNPNLLDLMVAIFSGIAGAYANSKSEVAKSLAGVAIAVALVPPLSVTGIGLGWGDMDMVYGSFLLFVTNLVGITLASSLTFLFLGYSAVKRAKKGIVYTTVIMTIIAIPLILSFNKALEQNNIYNILHNKSYVINNKTVNINISQVDLNTKEPLLYITVNSSSILIKQDLMLLKDTVQEHLGKKVTLNIVNNMILK
ncbi:MAG: TIGR00341 family protein [Campylobacterota bacterium]|nr:TIGR00341 family protein [Campylobacterota bacterium]